MSETLPPAEPDTQGKRKPRRRLRRSQKVVLWIIGVPVGIFVLLIIIGAIASAVDPQAASSTKPVKAVAAKPTTVPKVRVVASASSSAAKPKPRVSTQATSSAPAPVDPVAVTTAALRKAVGESAAGRPAPTFTLTGKPGEQIQVTFPAGDNLTEAFIADSMALSVTNALKAVRADATWSYGSVRVVSTFPMTDALGNSKEERIFSATYPKSTIDQINFTGFDFNNIGAIGNYVYEDPAVAKHIN